MSSAQNNTSNSVTHSHSTTWIDERKSLGRITLPTAFEQMLLDKIAELDRRVQVVESVSVSESEYLSRKQAMLFLHVGSTKLWEITQQNLIDTSTVTGRIMYSTASCKKYLLLRGFSQAQVDKHVQDLILLNQGKKRVNNLHKS